MNRISVKDNIISLDDCQDIFADGNNIVVNDNTELIITNSNLTCRMELNIIIEETDRLNKLVEDILVLSSMQAKTSDLELEQFDLIDVIKSIIKHYSIFKDTEGYVFIEPSIKYKNNKIVDTEMVGVYNKYHYFINILFF